ncbi:MAG: ATPase domain-containing protein [Candidatus Micrarchaeota archaeon]
MNRLKSGIPGLDELIEGGFPESSSVMVTGSAGTGKSIFCLEYLYYGAKDYQEPGVYITMEEGPHNLWWNMQRFKWDFLPLERDGLLKIYKFEPSLDMQEDIEGQITRIVDKARERNAKRLVIDSITAFSFWIENVSKIRYAIYTLIEQLRKLNCTTILTCEVEAGKNVISRFGVEEFLVDGVIQMHFTPPHRSMLVRKMRGTAHDMRLHPVEIDSHGLHINPKEEVLWESLRD